MLKSVLLTGYDFTRNVSGGSERVDVNASPDTSSGSTGEVNQRTVAVLDQRTVAVLDGTQYSAFGHGTMTAGLVHLVAPQAKILPLKAFHSGWHRLRFRCAASHLLRSRARRQGDEYEFRLLDLFTRTGARH